jgi:hypothetical protein
MAVGTVEKTVGGSEGADVGNVEGDTHRAWRCGWNLRGSSRRQTGRNCHCRRSGWIR